MANTQTLVSSDFPNLRGLTEKVDTRKSGVHLSLRAHHIDQNNDDRSEVRTIEHVAFYPLYLLLKKLSPFDYTIEENCTTPQSFVPVFSNIIKLYQLYIFYVYAIDVLGSTPARKTLEIQNRHLETWLDNAQTAALTARFNDISIAAKKHFCQQRTNLGSVSLDIPVEQSIAKILLLKNKDSRFYLENNDSTADAEVYFRGMDLALAEHLGLAKDSALKVYARYFDVVIVKV